MKTPNLQLEENFYEGICPDCSNFNVACVCIPEEPTEIELDETK